MIPTSCYPEFRSQTPTWGQLLLAQAVLIIMPVQSAGGGDDICLTWGSLLEEAVLGEGVPTETLLVSPEGASLLQPTARLARSGRARIDPRPVVLVLRQEEVVAREVSVDVGTLRQGQSVPVDHGSRGWLNWSYGSHSRDSRCLDYWSLSQDRVDYGWWGHGGHRDYSSVEAAPGSHPHTVHHGDAVSAQGGHILHHVDGATPGVAGHRHVGTLGGRPLTVPSYSAQC